MLSTSNLKENSQKCLLLFKSKVVFSYPRAKLLYLLLPKSKAIFSYPRAKLSSLIQEKGCLLLSKSKAVFSYLRAKLSSLIQEKGCLLLSKSKAVFSCLKIFCFLSFSVMICFCFCFFENIYYYCIVNYNINKYRFIKYCIAYRCLLRFGSSKKHFVNSFWLDRGFLDVLEK